MARVSQTPRGRGFDESLIYFEGAEDHFSQRSCQDPECTFQFGLCFCGLDWVWCTSGFPSPTLFAPS